MNLLLRIAYVLYIICGVCDTPELWCGAAGLCARVCACAGAAKYLHTYTQTYLSLVPCLHSSNNSSCKLQVVSTLSVATLSLSFFSLLLKILLIIMYIYYILYIYYMSIIYI